MKIVVGYLRSPEGQAALNVAATAAKDLNADLLVIHSYEPRESEGEAESYDAELDEVSDRLEAIGVPHSIRALSRGMSPAAEIVKVAAEVDAGLVVVGLRTRSPVGKALLGSVTQSVLFDSPCPVLTVKAGDGGRWTVPHPRGEYERSFKATRLDVDPRDVPPIG